MRRSWITSERASGRSMPCLVMLQRQVAAGDGEVVEDAVVVVLRQAGEAARRGAGSRADRRRRCWRRSRPPTAAAAGAPRRAARRPRRARRAGRAPSPSAPASRRARRVPLSWRGKSRRSSSSVWPNGTCVTSCSSAPTAMSSSSVAARSTAVAPQRGDDAVRGGAGAERVIEARVHRAGVDQIGGAELLDAAQPLHLRRCRAPPLSRRLSEMSPCTGSRISMGLEMIAGVPLGVRAGRGV